MSLVTGLAIAFVAAITCLALGALAAKCALRYRRRAIETDGAAAYDRAVANARALGERARQAALATDEFEALTHCPSCGTYGPHLMREPRRASAADVKAWEARQAEFLDEHRDEIERVEISSWGRGPVQVVDCGPTFHEPRPVDETEYAIIRTCECGKEWGQK